jgi:hypothetical protein
LRSASRRRARAFFAAGSTHRRDQPTSLVTTSLERIRTWAFPTALASTSARS